MKTWVAASAFVIAAWTATARAESRVSIEVGGAVSAYDLGASSAGVSRAGLHTASTVGPSSVAGATASQGGGSAPLSGIAVAEVRPTVMLDNGLLFAVGFRAGQAGLGGGGTGLVGGDVSLGYQHRFGRLIPFVKAMFGFNNYDSLDHDIAHPSSTDLRVDAVLGSRLYLTQRMFISAAAFGGYGDRYGASLAVGGDVVQFWKRGALP
jgi:hypothetical protein